MIYQVIKSYFSVIICLVLFLTERFLVDFTVFLDILVS